MQSFWVFRLKVISETYFVVSENKFKFQNIGSEINISTFFFYKKEEFLRLKIHFFFDIRKCLIILNSVIQMCNGYFSFICFCSCKAIILQCQGY